MRQYSIEIKYGLPGEKFSINLIEDYDTLEYAKETLKRIRDHYYAVRNCLSWGIVDSSEFEEKYKEEPWYCKSDYDNYLWIMIKDYKGRDTSYSAEEWAESGRRLISARIVDNTMEFETDNE